MNPIIAQDLVDAVIELARTMQSEYAPLLDGAGWILLWLLPVAGLCFGLYYLLGLPMRRRERARVFLDLIETGLRRGQTPEQTIVSSAGSQDPALGVRFHILAEYIRDGLTLEEALQKVSPLLPPSITATLKAGLETGDIGRVLPACRKQLRDGVSQTRGASNFLLVMIFIILPVFPVLVTMITVWVMPRFREIYKDMIPGAALPASWLWESYQWLVCAQIVLTVSFQLLASCYIIGPRLKGWLGRRLQWLLDSLHWRLPWRRKRMQRDFCTMLALLLDAGLPESRAVGLAASATASLVLQKRAATAGAALAGGAPLPAAIEFMDDTGELGWRLGNAARSGQTFMHALAGWIEALDARAFQQEQIAAQLLTSGLVLFNGVCVASIAISVFLVLITLIREGTLW